MVDETPELPDDIGYICFRVVLDEQTLVGEPVKTVEEAFEQCDKYEKRITHNRFGNVFDAKGISRRLDLRTGGIRDYRRGHGYEIHMVNLEEED